MEELRNYLQNSNGDIFEIINKAIRVAAADYPLEFQNNKHKIVDALYTSPLVKCSGQGDDDKHNSDVTNNDGSPKNQIIPKRSTVIRIKLKKKTQDKTDDGDTTTSLHDKQIEEVLKIKRILENNQGESELLCELLYKVQNMGLGLDVLEATGLEKTVNVCQKHESKDVNQIAKTLITQWKNLVDERFEKQSSPVKLSSEKPTSTNMEKRSQTDSGKSAVMVGSKMATPNQKGENSMEEKFKLAKRKLQQSYQEAENLKKQRKIHVIEFHELSRHGLLPRQQRQHKSSNEQLRRRANVHSRIPRLVPTF